MARPRTRIPLNVFLNGRHVGQLRKDRSGAIEFQYVPFWLAWDNAIPVSLSMPLQEERFIGAPVAAVFENLLPDNDNMRRRVAERAGAAGTDPYSLLTAIGRDCVGALQFMPDIEEMKPLGRIEGRRVSDEKIGAILRDLGTSPLGITDGEFRISLAGVQHKTALLRWKGRWHQPTGTTPTTHILKPQIGMLPNGIDLSSSVENEHFCLELVRAFDLPTAKSEIVDFGGKRTLVVERFDRFWTKDNRLLRVPQEDCCQALSVPPSLKYENQGGPGILRVEELLKGSDEPRLDQIRFFKAQIIFWLIGATDGHAKNFSIRLAPGGRFALAPLYDILSAQPNLDAGQIRRNRMKLAMALGKSKHYVIHTIAARHFIETAHQSKLPVDPRTVLEEIADTAPGAIEATFDALPSGFPLEVATSIANAALARRELLSAG